MVGSFTCSKFWAVPANFADYISKVVLSIVVRPRRLGYT